MHVCKNERFIGLSEYVNDYMYTDLRNDLNSSYSKKQLVVNAFHL